MNEDYAEEWLQEAEVDLHEAGILLANQGIRSALLLQQAVEKLLKAYLIAHGWRLSKTHELADLLDEATKYHPPLVEYRDICKEIGKFYIGGRYPSRGGFDPLEGRELTVGWVQETYDAVLPMIDFIRAKLSEPDDANGRDVHDE